MKRRDLSLIIITALVMCIPIAILAHKINDQSTLPAAAYNWKDIKVIPTLKGERREVFNSPTETLDQLELHITTLNPGDSSHAPHQHPNEELIIIKEGNVSAMVAGKWQQIGPGSVVYEAANSLHAIKNTGSTRTTYYALQWKTAKTGKTVKVN
jgi:quercetin dioxygenase-like cupin family protein